MPTLRTLARVHPVLTHVLEHVEDSVTQRVLVIAIEHALVDVAVPVGVKTFSLDAS